MASVLLLSKQSHTTCRSAEKRFTCTQYNLPPAVDDSSRANARTEAAEKALGEISINEMQCGREWRGKESQGLKKLTTHRARPQASRAWLTPLISWLSLKYVAAGTVETSSWVGKQYHRFSVINLLTMAVNIGIFDSTQLLNMIIRDSLSVLTRYPYNSGEFSIRSPSPHPVQYIQVTAHPDSNCSTFALAVASLRITRKCVCHSWATLFCLLRFNNACFASKKVIFKGLAARFTKGKSSKSGVPWTLIPVAINAPATLPLS